MVWRFYLLHLLMDLKEIFLELQQKSLDIKISLEGVDLNNIYQNKRGWYLNCTSYYLARFKVVPHNVSEAFIDLNEAHSWFLENYKNEITDFNTQLSILDSTRTEVYDVYYFVYEDLMINFQSYESGVLLLFKKTCLSKVENILNGLKKFHKGAITIQDDEPEISLLVNKYDRISTQRFEITKPTFSISDNYNNDFIEVHEIIKKRLSKKNDKGIVLLHGKPGTGKTSYIRHLISSVKKEVIFLPLTIANFITNPDLLSILVESPNSIFVIEDAENIIVDRDKTGNSAVSVLLNIADRLLSDCLNIQIICSFNIDIAKVDTALLRKGRLIAKYEFKELEVEKAQALSDKLGNETTITQPMTLADIYNQTERRF